MQKRIFLFLTILLLFIIGVLPVLFMLIKSVLLEGRFSLQAYTGVLASKGQWTLMENSFTLSFLVAFITTVVGVPLGLLLGKTDLPLRRFFLFLFVIPLLIPPYVTAVSWFDMFGREGFASLLLGASFGEMSSRFLFGLPGCTAVLSTVFLPVPVLLTIVFLRTINPRLEEAGRLVSGWRGVLAEITIPLLLPGILLSAMLTFLLSFGEFGVPNFLRFPVFPVESFTRFSAFYDFKAATAATVPMLLVVFVILLSEAFFMRKRNFQLRPSAETKETPLIPLGIYRNGVFVLVALFGFLFVVLPILVLFVQSSGLQSYSRALQGAGDSLLRSLLYAVMGATLLTLLGFFNGYLIRTKAFAYWRAVDFTTIFLFALPGTVIGIGLITLWNNPQTNFIYGTLWLILFGYLAKYIALTSRITVTGLNRISPAMEEAAQMAGAGWLRRIIFIVAPLARRSLVAGWIVGYIFSLRDTAITMLVYPAGHDTLPVRIFTMMANGSAELIAALCIILLLATLLPAAAVWMAANVFIRKMTP